MDINQLKRKLNAHKYTREMMNDMKLKINNNELPDFRLNGSQIIYSPTQQIIVCQDDVENKIKEIYDQTGLGSGIKNLYEKVSRNYIGISRKNVENWLKSQINYQLWTKPAKQTNKKLHSTGINKILCADLIDMNPYVSKNKQYRYILTIVDVFSKYVMLAKLKDKQPRNIRDGFTESIILRSNPIYPVKAILTDNGGEMKNELMREFCLERNIKQIFGLSHSPKSNALVEQTNGLVRRVLSQLFIRNGNTKWCDNLDEVANSINDSVPSGYNYTRNQIYFEEETKDALSIEREKHKQDLKKTRGQQLKIGDKVRIALSAIEPSIRAKIKEGNQKLVNAHFSLEVYTIYRVNKSKSLFLRDSYNLKDDTDNEIIKGNFYSNQLTKVPDNTSSNDKLTNEIIKRLNGIH